ncbi:multidrug resistance pump, putative [Perkinsus marinus ATCC 50983]|uniref:Multidrug resistance pump, putative n=1 Tax=Perkinsus marinus (strain ATCC 50983 / TXsc) TaxID=423536 RepID=C5LQJ7_PERM5|nr:multidrug resistance pump, putative [Perkinsus marinus ATCC 50983]EER01043.1 multidrug resistance pump, putative [Perkinsus marinus ATCC 50983]|eukprot:XP_002768325.1 multidrug resistance pump, putative [Perkinsus marinus ATCC 50983]
MLALDWWSSEIFSMIVGLLHDTAQLAAHVAAANLYNLVYTFTLGLSSAVGILVGLSIGKGNVSIAHAGSRCGLVVSVLSGAVIGALLVLGSRLIAELYAPGQVLVHHYLYYIIPIIALSMLTSSAQASLAGTCKGLGYQKTAAMSNFKGLYLVMLPLGTYMCLWTSLGVAGAWIARVSGTLVVSVLLHRKLSALDWDTIAIDARARMNRDREDAKTTREYH